jgi:hypothetical protein
MRLRELLLRGRTARFSAAAATGEARAVQAAEALCRSPLLRGGDLLGGVRAIALGVLAGADLRLTELNTIMDRIQGACRRDCRIEMGTVLDGEFDGRIELVALFFENCTLPEEPGADAALVDMADVLADGGSNGKTKGGDKGSKLRRSPGRFRGVEPTLHAGEVLDTPTYLRRKIVLER